MPVDVVRLKKKCGAKTRQTNPDGSPKLCERWAMQNGRCPNHGGKSLRGVAHPNYVHGRKTRTLPPRMIEDASAAYHDPELASLREDIVVMDARVVDLIKRVDTGESGRLLREMRDALKEYKRAELVDDPDKAAYWWNILEGLILDGVADYDAWDEVARAVEMRARLIEKEQKRLVANGQMIPADRALAIFGRILEAVKQNVHDRKALANISRVAYTLVQGPTIEVLEADDDDAGALVVVGADAGEDD